MEREKRDLFAERNESDHGDVKPTLLPPPSFGFTAGARNEDSVLFRVDQIPETARIKTPEPSPATVRLPGLSSSPRLDAPREESRPAVFGSDDGVIDLKALSQAPPALRPVALPVAPLFSEPPPVSVEVASRRARPASKLRLIGGLAVAAIALMGIGVGVAYAFKGEEPVTHRPAAVEPPPELAPAPSATAPAPAPSASVANNDDQDQDTDVKGTKGKKAKRGRGKSKGVITNKTPPPAAKRVKAADPCGCHGDFNCILACTANGGK